MRRLTLKSALFLVCIMSCFCSFGQADDELEQETETRAKPKKTTANKISNWEKDFILSVSTSTYFDLIKSPLKMVSVIVGNDPDPNNPNNVIPRYKEVPYQSFTQNFFSMGIEPRYNFRELSADAAFALTMPISLGVGMTFSATEDVLGKEGFGSIQVPLMLKFYLGNGSTYESEKDYGVSFGGGLEYNNLGILNLNNSENATSDYGFVLPVASFGFHFWRNNSPVEINLKYGNGAIEEYDVDRYGNPLRDGFGNLTSIRTRSSSFKISFVTILNY